jgi:hypothetical protein
VLNSMDPRSRLMRDTGFGVGASGVSDATHGVEREREYGKRS